MDLQRFVRNCRGEEQGKSLLSFTFTGEVSNLGVPDPIATRNTNQQVVTKIDNHRVMPLAIRANKKFTCFHHGWTMISTSADFRVASVSKGR